MSFISKWKEKIAHYIEVRLDLIKLGIIERTSNILSYLILVFIFLFLAASILIFIGIGISEFFYEVVGVSKAAGFFITAGIYFLLLVILFFSRNAIVRGFSGVFIRILTAEDEDEDKDERSKSDIKVE